MQACWAGKAGRVFIRIKRGCDMDTEGIIHQVREFLGQFISNTDIEPDENLFTSGAVNSLFAMQLVLYVEKEFGIQVANEDLDFDNFKSLNAIVGFIESKSNAAG